MDYWDCDAPQFVDFMQSHTYDNEYQDSWFDKHTEEADFERRSKGSDSDSGKKSQMKQPQRVLRSIGTSNRPLENMETNGRSPREMKSKPARVLAEKHVAQPETKSICPSPSKRMKTTESHNVLDSSSPAANTRRRTTSPSDHLETTLCGDCPAANTRQRTPHAEGKSKSPNHLSQARIRSPKKALGKVKSMTNLKEKPPIHMTDSTSATKSPRKQAKDQASKGNSAIKAKATPQMSTTLKRSQSLKCRMLGTSANKVLNKDKAESEHHALESSKDKLTTDLCLKSFSSSSNNNKGKTTEELELEKIAAMKRELAKTRKLAQESYKKAMSTQGYVPMRAAQPATMPIGFNFKTDERIKNQDTNIQEQKVKDFTKSLREALPQSTLPTKSQVHGLTRPQPFKLTAAKSTGALPQAEKFESVAERVLAFHRKTPDRCRTQPHGSKERSRATNKSSCDRRMRSQSPPKLTVAKTPNLVTQGRARPMNAVSRADKELMEFEEQQKQQFRAHPVNYKVFEAPSLPKVNTKQSTVVEEFNFMAQKSVSMENIRRTVKDAQEDKYEFHAKPVNPKILMGPVGVKPAEQLPITIPESPAFALKNRIRAIVDVPKKEETKEHVKSNPVPYMGIPFKPRLDHHFTIPEPFSVEERSREMLNRKEQKIQHILEEEKKMHEFYAQGLPSDSPDQLPPKQVRPVTQPEPFYLEVDERGQRYQEEFRIKLEEEEKAARENVQFKAGSNTVIHREPFKPQKSMKPLTEKGNFALNTDVRAAQREAFDEHLKAREAELEALRRQREERQREEEKMAVARMRLEAVHKATSIKKYKSVIVKPSDKPLTEAQSPRFSQRVRTRHNNSDI